MKHPAVLLRGLLIIFTYVKYISAQSERDIILTPKLGLQVKGKTLYYKPTGDYPELNGTIKVPWEQTLKHVTYLTLNNQISEKSTNLSDLPEYKNFLKSPYIPSNEYIPKFGDIITLAKGRLEKAQNDEYRFVEGQCSKKCMEEQQKLIAFWIVQKIRHRDSDRKFRYEIKFSVNPNVSDKIDSKREIGKRKVRAFVLKDDDYPKNFIHLDQHVEQRHYDQYRGFTERLSRFNNVFAQPRHFQSSEATLDYNRALPELNIGEYVRDTSISPRISAASNRLIFPTTYRPQYHIKFSKPSFDSESSKYTQYSLNAHEADNIGNSVPSTTHLHHHYYVTKPQLPDTKPILHNNKEHVNFPFLKDHRGAIDIIERPLHASPSPVPTQQDYHTPSPISNQIPVPPNMSKHIQITQTPYSIPITNPIIPAPPVIYMQPIPLSHHIPVYVYPQTNEQTNGYIHPTRPFIESPKDEAIRYSEPDPLFHHINFNSESNLPTLLAKHVEITSPSVLSAENTDIGYDNNNSEYEEKPDSINAQLPPPEKDEDLSVPYVETSIITQTSATTSDRLVASSLSSTETSSYEKQFPTISKASDETYTSEETSAGHKDLSTEDLLNSSTSESEPISDESLRNNEPLEKSSTTKVELENSQNIKISPLINTTTLEPILKTTENNNKTKKLTKLRSYLRSTTDRPILKWTPKRTKLNKLLSATTSTKPISVLPNATNSNEFLSPKFEFEAIPVNVTQKIIAVTTPNDVDVQTKQSVSTSISIKVGTEEEERPFLPTITVPNVELYRANLENIGTNSSNIKLYMASDQRRVFKEDKKSKDKEEKEELELANSIVQHVQSLY